CRARDAPSVSVSRKQFRVGGDVRFAISVQQSRGVAVSSETALSRWRRVVGSSSTENAAFLSSVTMLRRGECAPRFKPRDQFVRRCNLPEKPLALRAGFARHASEHPAFLG